MPTRMIATISSEVPTGRSMKIRDGFMSRPELLVGLGGSTGAVAAALARAVGTLRAGRAAPLLRRRCTVRLRRRCTVRLRHRTAVGRSGGDAPAPVAGRTAPATNLGAVAQAVGAVDHHLAADRQT